METQGKVIPDYLSKYLDLIENFFFMGRLKQFWSRLIKLAEIKPHERIIDIGSGSGKMVEMISSVLSPKGEIIGLEPSRKLVENCNKLNTRENVKFIEGVMENIPYTDNSFDVVLSSLAIHHVPRKIKKKAFKEFKRVLKKGGRVLILDHGKPYNIILQILLFPMRWNVLEYQAENFRGEIPKMINEEFENVEEKDRFYGWIKIWQAVKN